MEVRIAYVPIEPEMKDLIDRVAARYQAELEAMTPLERTIIVAAMEQAEREFLFGEGS
jgi:hypothetical protein